MCIYEYVSVCLCMNGCKCMMVSLFDHLATATKRITNQTIIQTTLPNSLPIHLPPILPSICPSVCPGFRCRSHSCFIADVVVGDGDGGGGMYACIQVLKDLQVYPCLCESLCFFSQCSHLNLYSSLARCCCWLIPFNGLQGTFAR